MDNHLIRLQQWYAAQSNGEWEHSHGISLGTLDNPGWNLTIDLEDTNLAGREFKKVHHQGKASTDWYMCEIKGEVFEAAGGAENLQDMIRIFVEWANPV